ncbi:MAG: hypothetical protein ACW987_20430 [Candidatus Thorarchaeota archaeon]|jgi:hypothetical protein
MDYKQLLKKYMNHVGENEGVHFIPCAYLFSEEEVKELKSISDEIIKESIDGHAAQRLLNEE